MGKRECFLFYHFSNSQTIPFPLHPDVILHLSLTIYFFYFFLPFLYLSQHFIVSSSPLQFFSPALLHLTQSIPSFPSSLPLSLPPCFPLSLSLQDLGPPDGLHYLPCPVAVRGTWTQCRESAVLRSVPHNTGSTHTLTSPRPTAHTAHPHTAYTMTFPPHPNININIDIKNHVPALLPSLSLSLPFTAEGAQEVGVL